MTDIVERLRLIDPTLELRYCEDVTKLHEIGQWCHEGADEIERLREVLRPFACKCESDWCEKLRFNDDKEKCENYIARAALREKE